MSKNNETKQRKEEKQTPVLYRSTRRAVPNMSNLPSEETFDAKLPRNLSNLPSEWKDKTRKEKGQA